MKSTHHFSHSLQRQICNSCDYKVFIASQLVSPLQKVEDGVVSEVDVRLIGVEGELMASGVVRTLGSVGIYYVVRCSSSHPNTRQEYQTKSQEMLKNNRKNIITFIIIAEN